MGIAGTLLWSISAIVLDLVGDGENVQACTGRRSRGAREQGRGEIKLGSLKPWQSGRTRTAHMVGCWLLGPVCQSSHIDCTYHRNYYFIFVLRLFRLPTLRLCFLTSAPSFDRVILFHIRVPAVCTNFSDLLSIVHSARKSRQVAASRGKWDP